jgi:thymidylate kinase
LPIATELFRAFNEAGLKYGIIQDLGSLHDGLAGRDDLDVLLDRHDYPVFCSIVSRLHGRRGVSLSCYDNVCAGREDWFVPDFSHGRYLHLDMHIGVRIGWEFRKRYPTFDYAAITRWEPIYVDGVPVPVVSPEDELRITIARFAFRAWALPGKQWISVGDRWKDQFACLPFLPCEQGWHVVEYAFGGRTVSCRFRQSAEGLVAHRGDLARLRRSIREMSGFTGRYGIADATVHLVRKTSYLALRFLQRLMPGRLPPKRRPAAGGFVVALIGPDGLGKSTQVDRLTQIFRWKFGCAHAYVGTGDGNGWWLRKALQSLVFPHRRRLKSLAQHDGKDLSGRNWGKGGVAATALALWAVLIAFERYAVVKRAHRWATRGLIVICDRWPQSLRRGYLDGPTIPPHLFSSPGLSALARIEQELYRKMAECRPHLTLHLVSDFAVSEQRKPGEIRKEAFDARLSLMAELRAKDKNIRTIDASAGIEAVGREMFRHIWLSL